MPLEQISKYYNEYKSIKIHSYAIIYSENKEESRK